MASHSFLPPDFVVPPTLETPEFRLRMLTVHEVVKDYDAVMSSVEHCRTIWGGQWPLGLTLEQNLIDLGWHQKEFQTRRSFAYTVVDPGETRVLGCVYILPTLKRGHDAEVYLWARQSELDHGLEDRLYAATSAWVASSWPFKAVAYPGRSLSLAQWHAIENEPRTPAPPAPSPATVEAFVQLVEAGRTVEAMERFYAEHATMQENEQAPRVGKCALIAHERAALASVAALKAACVRPILQSGATVVIRWIFEIEDRAGHVVRFEELAHQRWEGELIAEEKFFYDPGQLRPASPPLP